MATVSGTSLDPRVDVAVIVGPDDRAELLQAAWWEPTRIQYGLGRGYIAADADEIKQGSGAWVHPMQILNRPYTVPATGEKRPAEVREIEQVGLGNGDPESDDFDVRTLVAAQGNVIEIRLPWALLGFADPSSLKLFDAQPDGAVRTLDVERVGIAVVAEGGELLTTSGYAWEPWQAATWHERRKVGLNDLGETMRELSAAGLEQ